MEIMYFFRIYFAKFFCKEISLFLVIPFNIDFVTWAKDCFQKFGSISSIYDFTVCIDSTCFDSFSSVIASGMPVLIAWFNF